LLAAGLLGCAASAGTDSSADASPAPVPTGYSSVNGTPVLLLRPQKPTNRLVLYVHGSGSQADVLEEEQVQPLVRAFLRRGFAVAASNGGGEDNWGSPKSVEDSVMLARRTGYKHIYILAQSMGGIGGVELIDRLHPVAWAGIFPVCNARSLWNINNGRAEMEAVWGPGPPPARISPVKAKDVKGLRVMMFASPEDTAVPIAQNAEQCAAWMGRRGAQVTLVETTGEHGDPSNFQPARLSSFFARAPIRR
jgi:pimeloyl-ACP methyl ester carboxylesterase